MLILPAYNWAPRPHQVPAWNALAKGVHTAVLAWHRRAGKDEIALHNCAIKAMERTGNYWHLLPMQEQSRKALWESVNPRTGRLRWKDAFPDEIIEHVDNQGMKITFKNHSTWQLLGSDNYDSLVGTTPVGMTFSEAALGDPSAYAFFRPILLENNGWSLHISSVRGRNHFYKLFHTYKNMPGAFCELLSAEDTGIFSAIQLLMEKKVYHELYGKALGNALFEQEYMSSWDAAIIGAVWGEELKALRAEGRALPLQYDPRYPVETSWDIGVGDTNVILFWQTVGNIERLFDWYASTDTGIEHYAEVLAKKRYFYGIHTAPHDIVNKEWGTNGVGRMATAKKLGIHFRRIDKYAKGDSIAAASRLINMMQINVQDHEVDDPMDDCSFLIDTFAQYRFQFDKERKVMSKNPVHDWTSHYADALQNRGLYVAERSPGFAGRPMALQGAGVDIQQYDQRRLRDILAAKSKSHRGAFG